MNLPRYEITSDENAYMYHFISEGNKGKIEKVVIYEEMEIEGFFNLGFGDRNPVTGYLDDEITTDNGDTEKVLATVVATLYRFTDQFPDVYVYAKGSTDSRNRLYRMSITKYLTQALEDFFMYGILPNGQTISFVPNFEYIGFIIHRKN